MPTTRSPLRYPGGKTALAAFLTDLIYANGVQGGTYVEPFAGGAGAALDLLLGEHVQRIWINDADYRIYAFWRSVLFQTERFLEALEKAQVNVREWEKQRDACLRPRGHSVFQVGFATFYLNRCNHSGILLKAGPVGGRHQRGKWKIGARFDRAALRRKIELVALYRERVDVTNLDAVEFLRTHLSNKEVGSRTLVYLDPPYFVRGSELYMNHYEVPDHQALARFITRQNHFRWLMSYDNVPQIRRLYRAMNLVPFQLNYSANSPKLGQEVLIYNDDLLVPLGNGNLRMVV